MKLAAITCTNQRHAAMERCARYMEEQIRQPDMWVVVGSMQRTVESLQCGDEHEMIVKMIRNDGEPGWANFVANMRCALRYVPEDYAIAFFEDDDWYRPDHLAMLEEALETAEAVGVCGMRYFHLGTRTYLDHQGPVRPLAGLAFRGRQARAAMLKAIDTAQDLQTYAIDRFFWRLVKMDGISHIPLSNPTVIGIKGWGGAGNLGIGRDPSGWTPDPDGEQLRRWVGDDADFYLSLPVTA